MAPIFQGGRLRNSVKAAEAQYSQFSAAFGRAVLTAVYEVEISLKRYENERVRYAFLTSQRDEARASADLQARRYASGAAGYTDYLDALRTLLGVQSTLASAGSELALARLAVHRALGGGWTKGVATQSTSEAITDGIVMVVRADSTAQHDVEAALEILDRGKILGLVLNGVRVEQGRYGYSS